MHKTMFDNVREAAYRKAYQAEFQKGFLEGQRRLFLKVLELKFGDVPTRVRTKITHSDGVLITRLVGDLLSAERISELKF